MKCIITAPRGKMARYLVQVAARTEGVAIVGAVAPKGRPYLGMDAGQVCGLGEDIGVRVTDDLAAIIDTCDLVVDFSTVEMSMQTVALCVQHKKALMCGTTGFSPEQMQGIREAAQHIPLLFAANTSLLVNLMNEVLTYLAAHVGQQSQIEIIEMHDAQKLDAPSGTSREMAERMAHAMGHEVQEVLLGPRISGELPGKGSIAIHSVRAGDIVSVHTVLFGTDGERLEITHRAESNLALAKGAIRGVQYMERFLDQPGLYGIKAALLGEADG